ncbi:MAG: phosphatase PAP2 family protein [Lachnospiraceae bacterium]|nr:phosphatase PAP2 family protein [Lachnospiraceae bacterium]
MNNNDSSDNRIFTMEKIIVGADRIITALTVLAYILVLILFYNMGIVKLIEAIAIPGISFLIVSAFRYLYNAPRPYEVSDIKPMSGKKTKGKSMPSRHTFSIFVIAMTIFYYDYRFGICFLIAGTILAALRVLERVHFVKDVVVGAILGIAFGLVYYILPILH